MYQFVFDCRFNRDPRAGYMDPRQNQRIDPRQKNIRKKSIILKYLVLVYFKFSNKF